MRLHGSGIEFGPGTSPLGCLWSAMWVADLFPNHHLIDRAYPAQGMDFARLSMSWGWKI